jgi:acetyl esterase
MPLDPQVRAFLDELEQAGAAPLSSLAPQQARAVVREDMPNWDPPQPVARIENRRLPGPAGSIPIRIYAPETARPSPVLVYYHGGGWTLCDLDTHDGACTRLANGAGCLVVSVDYRLAPEHKYPAAADDCYAAFAWVAENAAQWGGDARRVAVGGDSAGGNLAAVVSMMARDRGARRPLFQLLIYPATDFRGNTPSYSENAEGYLLSRDDMRWFWANYLAREEDGQQPYASPLLAGDFRHLPPAFIATAEYDPLRDEGEAYGARLRLSGVPAEVVRYDGLIHAFLQRTERFDRARKALADMCRALGTAFTQTGG